MVFLHFFLLLFLSSLFLYRPTVEIFGEFGGKFAMNQKFNNAMLSLRKESPLSVKMLELSCAHPKSVQRADIDTFCRVTGNPCNTHWWYNHGPQQWAARNGHGKNLYIIVVCVCVCVCANKAYPAGLILKAWIHIQSTRPSRRLDIFVATELYFFNLVTLVPQTLVLIMGVCVQFRLNLL